jgi:uncharacterized cupredoxin-like copper-binding protein
MIEVTDLRGDSARRRCAGLVSKARQVRKLALLGMTLLGATAADAKTLYVNGGKTSSGDGSSWNQSIRFLQSALVRAQPGDDVYLAKGTYFPDDGIPNRYGDREISFELDKVNLYGGFVGNENSLSQRNVTANKTILSGEIWEVADDPDTGESNGYERYWSLHVVKVNVSSRLDGLTIQRGRANGEGVAPARPTDSVGGGILVAAGQTLRLANCTLLENFASRAGGAIHGTVIATSSRFIDNQVNNESNLSSYPTPFRHWLDFPDGSGGAVEGEITASRCTFTNNTVTTESLDIGIQCSATGGAINGPKITLADCTFDSNAVSATADYWGDNRTSTARARGGAISGPSTVTRCIFVGNTVYAGSESANSPDRANPVPHISRQEASGGALAGASVAVSCVFANNVVTAQAISGDNSRTYSAGAAMYLEGASTVTNCLFNGNIGESVDDSENVGKGGYLYTRGAVLAASGSTLPISNCTFFNNESSGKGAALASEGSVNILSNIFWFDGEPSTLELQHDQLIYVGERPENESGGRGRISNRLYPTPSTETTNLVKGGFDAVGTGANANVDFGLPPGRTFIGQDPTLNPGFLDITNPVGADGIWRTGDDGLRLTAASPAIGKGLGLFLAKDTADLDGDGNTGEPLPNDLASYVRLQDGSLDLGAYEFGQQINAPDISVEFPTGTVLLDNRNTVDLSAFSASAQTFVIRNTGNEILNSLAVSVTGDNSSDFRITQPKLTSLSLNATTTFTVTFRPGALGNRVAQLRIASNDPDENPFDIALTGSAALPDIAVEYPVGTNLTSGSSTIDYGTIAATSSATRTFTIRNTGAGNLQIDSIRSSGGNASSFQPSAAGVSFLAAGASTTFTVRFDGSAAGSLASTIIIGSSDPDAEAAFKINVKGFGKQAPEIVVSQPFSAEIKNGDKIDYGRVAKASSYTKTFVIKNTGTAYLKGIKVKLSGSKTYSLGKFKQKKLKPGASAQFTVTFNPTSKGKRSAVLRVISNDSNERNINISLIGKGIKKSKNNGRGFATAFSGLAAPAAATTSAGTVSLVKGDDGLNYQTLTVRKSAGDAPATVQVSSNLVDWCSGSRHTTTLVDNAAVLTVRDNTPVKKGEKRFIRLK